MQLFSLELWERFSYYGMNGILALYLYFQVSDGGLGMPQPTAIGIVGAYGGAVFLATILGAWVADRILGAEKILFYSAIIIMVGHICLALIPGFGGVAAGLILVALGSGGLKANASALVGELYTEKDPNAMPGSPCSIWASTSGHFSDRSSPVFCRRRSASTSDSVRLPSVWPWDSSSTLTGRKNLPHESRVAVNPLPNSKLYLFSLPF